MALLQGPRDGLMIIHWALVPGSSSKQLSWDLISYLWDSDVHALFMAMLENKHILKRWKNPYLLGLKNRDKSHFSVNVTQISSPLADMLNSELVNVSQVVE